MPEKSGKLKRTDPRDPLLLDTRELGRRPGAMRKVSRSVPAPADLGTVVLGVPEGSDLELSLQLESVVDGVYVSGSVRGSLVGECVRCLEPIERELVTPLAELYRYPDTEVHEDDDEDDLPRMEGDLLDLGPTLRDAVVLALPFKPVCRDDCPGLCPQCGARLADDPEHTHETVDTRWSALQDLYGPGAQRDGVATNEEP